MSIQATCTFEGKTWDEQPYNEIEGGPKLTRATVTNAFQGDIEGEGSLEYLLVYRDDNTAYFVGLERIVGRIGDRSGSFVIQQTGVFADGKASATCLVVPGSASGELRGLRGEGSFVAGHGSPTSFTLDYDFE